jgi:predicted TIM-barrel enzyme
VIARVVENVNALPRSLFGVIVAFTMKVDGALDMAVSTDNVRPIINHPGHAGYR